MINAVVSLASSAATLLSKIKFGKKKKTNTEIIVKSGTTAGGEVIDSRAATTPTASDMLKSGDFMGILKKYGIFILIGVVVLYFVFKRK